MMKEPKLTVALAVNDDRTTLMVLRADGGGMPSLLRWNLQEFEHEGYHALSQRVGDSVLRMLADAHPDEFAKCPLLVPPKQGHDDPRGVVLSLIRRSIKEKTTAYAAAIDALFKSDAADLGQTDLPETWRSIRATLPGI